MPPPVDEDMLLGINTILLFKQTGSTSVVIITAIPDTNKLFLDLLSARNGCYYFSDKQYEGYTISLAELRSTFPDYTITVAPKGFKMELEVV